MITYAVINEKGERSYQEDSAGVFCRGDQYAFWVADGLGGHGNGKEASSSVVDLAGKRFQNFDGAKDYLSSVFLEGNQLLLSKQDALKNKATLKTTLVGAVISQNQMTWAHAGDSRFYLFAKERVVTRTLDHSVPQMLALGGEIQECDIRKHPDRNRVLRVLGSRELELEPEFGPVILVEPEMKALLCSDGFWEWIEESEMEAYLSESRSPQEWLEHMANHVKMAGKGQGMDNYTALAIWI